MRRCHVLVVIVAAMPLASVSHAQQGEAETTADEDLSMLSEPDRRYYQRQQLDAGTYARVMLSTAFGRGFRFNNPFRLRSALGEGGESVSLTSPYWDAAVTTTLGDPDGLQHGASLHFSAALEGVSQQALSLTYTALIRGSWPVMGYGRLGPSLLTAPDANLGFEAALGGAVFVTGAVGFTAELLGNLYYGAGTYDTTITTVPILSGHAGLVVDLEVLP